MCSLSPQNCVAYVHSMVDICRKKGYSKNNSTKINCSLYFGGCVKVVLKTVRGVAECLSVGGNALDCAMAHSDRREPTKSSILIFNGVSTRIVMRGGRFSSTPPQESIHAHIFDEIKNSRESSCDAISAISVVLNFKIAMAGIMKVDNLIEVLSFPRRCQERKRKVLSHIYKRRNMRFIVTNI